MKRPLLVWLAFAACALVGGGVLAWFTREMLRLDHESTEARRLAAVEENTRLALWRMDSALAAVHGLEAVRPAQEYAPFFRADSAYSSSLAPLPGGTVLLPSPLLGYTPPFVKMHFQIESDGTMVSPQAPPLALRPAALAAGVPVDRLDLAIVTQTELRGRLAFADLAASLPPGPTAPFTAHALETEARREKAFTLSPLAKEREARAAEPDRETQLSRRDAPAAAEPLLETAPAPRPAAKAPPDEVQVQQRKNEAEQVARSGTLLQSNVNSADFSENRLRGWFSPNGGVYDPTRQQGSGEAGGSPPVTFRAPTEGGEPARLSESLPSLVVADAYKAQEESDVVSTADPNRPVFGAPVDTPASGFRDAEFASASEGRSQALVADELAVAGASRASPPTVAENETGSADVSGAVIAPAVDSLTDSVSGKRQGAADAPLVAPSFSATGGSAEGSLHAVWAGHELVFARRAVVDGRAVVQGAWLDWPELQAWLLSRVSDLLPQAKLEPALPGTASTAFDAARRLAFLPAQLMPGAVNVNARSLASPLRISIGLAWAGAAIGLVALALLLRGTLRLSERRGAFVSAVTHELRTPLTTFRMYTEMLSSGMVTDESKRRGYIDTLHKESERLSHLVENVLSYARLERGRAAARVEDTTPGALLARIEERLRQRAQQGGLAVRVEFADHVADAPLRTDTTAVEQVLFNLVDNATKYGRPKKSGGEITLAVASQGVARLAIRVADQGPGLTSAARKRLFQPFSKSATEAAHTQPGVGLGLALCRRLARDELHGELVLERTGPDGTVFRLELPVR